MKREVEKAGDGSAAGRRWAGRGPLRAIRVIFRRRFRRSRTGRWIGFGLLAVMIVVQLWNPLPVETLRLKVFDFYQVMRPRAVTSQPVAVVDLDEESLAEVGQWPWPRTKVGELVTRLMEYGAIAVGFDMVFAEPDRLSPGFYAESLEDVDPSLRDALRALPSNDEVFAEVLRNNPVVLGQVSYHRIIKGQEAPPAKAPIAVRGDDPRPYLIRFPSAVRNMPLLEEAAGGRAMFNLAPEQDGLVRRVPAMMVVNDVIHPALSLELLRIAVGRNMAYVIWSDSRGVQKVSVISEDGSQGFHIPTDPQGRIWVHYSRRDLGKIVSARDVLNRKAPREKLAGKLVLIGTSAAGLLDIKATPLHTKIPGVEVQAQILETILAGAHLKRPGWTAGTEVLMLAGVGLLIILLVPVFRAILTLFLGGLLAASLAALSWYFYVGQSVLFDVTYASVGGFGLYGALVFFNYAREEVRRRQVRGAFRQYLSPELVDQLAEDPERLVLGGETKEMSFLFCDVRGFTAISELYKSDPQGLTRLMNRFLTPLTEVILDHHGTIDKYMGDAIMAFWNAPLDDLDHARHACEAALDMLLALEALNTVRRAEANAASEDFWPLRVGIGINTGSCVVGNVGSDQRFDYSVLGDAVNLASRLEGQTSAYRVEVMIGSETARQVGDEFATLELDLIRVKGKREPETVHALLGGPALRKNPDYETLAAKNRHMLARYRAQDWPVAGQLAAELEEMDGVGADLTALFAYHRERIKAFQAVPPGPGWDGVFTATVK